VRSELNQSKLPVEMTLANYIQLRFDVTVVLRVPLQVRAKQVPVLLDFGLLDTGNRAGGNRKIISPMLVLCFPIPLAAAR
jgi:hypothetical protein